MVTYDTHEIRLFVYHGADRLSIPLSPEGALHLAYDLLSKVLNVKADMQTRT